MTRDVHRSARAALALLAIAAPARPRPPAPTCSSSAYSQDYEGLGRHYTVGATVKGDADRVSVRAPAGAPRPASAGHIEPAGRDNHLSIVDDHDWIRALRADLQADGAATVTVRAIAGGNAVRKRCALDYETDPCSRDFAGGKCRRIR